MIYLKGLGVVDVVSKNRQSEAGSVIFYIFAAFGLMAFLTFLITKGSGDSVTAGEVQKMTSLVKSDIETIRNAVQECALMYSDPVDIDGDNDTDVNDNPNVPFPIYNRSGTGFGGTGVAVKTIICPGSPALPAGIDKVLNGSAGKFLSTLGATNYTVTYFSDAATGIKVTIDNSQASSIWTETMARLDTQLDPNNAGIVDIDLVTGTCATGGGCLIYWIIKK